MGVPGLFYVYYASTKSQESFSQLFLFVYSRFAPFCFPSGTLWKREAHALRAALWPVMWSGIRHFVLQLLYFRLQLQEAVKITLEESVLGHAVLLKLALRVELACSTLTLPGPVRISLPLNSKKPSSRLAHSPILMEIFRSAWSSA